jgi:hypothetical protein
LPEFLFATLCDGVPFMSAVAARRMGDGLTMGGLLQVLRLYRSRRQPFFSLFSSPFQGVVGKVRKDALLQRLQRL